MILGATACDHTWDAPVALREGDTIKLVVVWNGVHTIIDTGRTTEPQRCCLTAGHAGTHRSASGTTSS